MLQYLHASSLNALGFGVPKAWGLGHGVWDLGLGILDLGIGGSWSSIGACFRACAFQLEVGGVGRGVRVQGLIRITRLSVNRGKSLGGATLANLMARRCFVDPSCFSARSLISSV